MAENNNVGRDAHRDREESPSVDMLYAITCLHDDPFN
jgi:hypothetical protein